MRALLKPCIQPDLGIVLLRPGSELMSLFRSRRVLISTEPYHMHNLPSGRLAEAEQPLLDHPGMLAFFTHERVISAAGGINVLEEHLMRGKGCQWSGDWHSSDHTTLRTGNGAVRLCYHCDNQLREVEPSPLMLDVAARNTALWVIDKARSAFMLAEAHQLSLPELCWWAATKIVTDLMPENAARQVLKLPDEKPLRGTLKESRIRPEPSAVSILEVQAKQVLEMAIDPETPETFLLRPKRRRWSNEKYTQWIKTQPCLCCGKQADDPHHLIGYGQGGMGTKAHDLFVLPLCRAHHDELHADVRAFESKYGTQPELIIRTLDRALALGVIATGKKNSGDKNA